MLHIRIEFTEPKTIYLDLITVSRIIHTYYYALTIPKLTRPSLDLTMTSVRKLLVSILSMLALSIRVSSLCSYACTQIILTSVLESLGIDQESLEASTRMFFNL